MNLGCYYLNILYPGFLELNDGKAFFISSGSKNFGACIIRKISALNVLDYDNQVAVTPMQGEDFSFNIKKPISQISNKNFATIEGENLPAVIDHSTHYSRIFHHRPVTEIIIIHEINDIDDTTNNFATAKKYLSEFIDIYRFVTKDTLVRLPEDIETEILLYKEALHRYLPNEQSQQEKDRLFTLRPLKYLVRGINIAGYRANCTAHRNNMLNNTKAISSYTSANKKFLQFDKSMMRSHEILVVHKQPSHALLGAFIAFETFIFKLVKDFKIDRGVSRNKFKTFENSVGVSYLINVELPTILGPPTDSERQMIADVDNVRTLRNDIVHNGEKVSETQALNAINSINKLVLHLRAKSFPFFTEDF